MNLYQCNPENYSLKISNKNIFIDSDYLFYFISSNYRKDFYFEKTETENLITEEVFIYLENAEDVVLVI